MPLSMGTSGSCFVNMAVKHEIQCDAVKILTNRVYFGLSMTIKQEIRK
jgi:hypothetical protein